MEQKELGDKDFFVEVCFVGGIKKLESVVCLLKGVVYEVMDNCVLVIDCYKDVFRNDVYCFEVFDLFVFYYMLMDKEERELLVLFFFFEQCMLEEVDLLKFLYESKMKKYCKLIDFKFFFGLESFNDNLDIVVGMVEWYFYNCSYYFLYKMILVVLFLDLYYEVCLFIYIICLVELKKINELFLLGYKLVDNYSYKVVVWYVVGCYYYVIEKYE